MFFFFFKPFVYIHGKLVSKMESCLHLMIWFGLFHAALIWCLRCASKVMNICVFRFTCFMYPCSQHATRRYIRLDKSLFPMNCVMCYVCLDYICYALCAMCYVLCVMCVRCVALRVVLCTVVSCVGLLWASVYWHWFWFIGVRDGCMHAYIREQDRIDGWLYWIYPNEWTQWLYISHVHAHIHYQVFRLQSIGVLPKYQSSLQMTSYTKPSVLYL